MSAHILLDLLNKLWKRDTCAVSLTTISIDFKLSLNKHREIRLRLLVAMLFDALIKK